MTEMVRPVRQERIFDFIVRYKQEYGYAPTTREIEKRMGLNRWKVNYVLDRMEESGLIHRDVGVTRSIRVMGTCPVCGKPQGSEAPA